MPANFPEIWLDRVITNLDESDQAPWLDGVAELDADVSLVGENTATESNIIHIAATDFDVDVLINNTTYPIPVQQYTDGSLQFTLDKYQTKVVTVSDDQIMGASYDKIDTVTKSSVRAILAEKYGKAIHSIAPQSHTTKTPVIFATGINGTDAPLMDGTRPRLTYDDLVRLKAACKSGKFPLKDRRLVLTEDHWNDLLLDRKNFGDKLVNYSEGQPAPKIAGFYLYTYENMPYFTSAGVKKAYGSVPGGTDRPGSIVFGLTGIAKKTGNTKQYFAEAKNNPSTQTNDLSYRHYFLATPFRAEKIGAII
ncbi:hypothetical protein N4T20_02545 [Flavobacterium sp. TR2]|uniref:hypothetical protein n=1 Tax=Flavobacterium sp. TR2 TaxID=2977321 RepID=UPI0021B0A132|nr:hypothetical protein [Flavobacterium sp. TR2]UWY28810.1 hypothetical protein N4T20_02545 [Flavobacterium sp. TR2]